MEFNKVPLNCTGIDFEIEAINRFRGLDPFLSPKCHIFRELNGNSPVLCLDFAACAEDLKMNKQEWKEFAQLLLHSSRYLGLANSLVFKNGDRILSWITSNQIQYLGQFLDKE